MSETMETTECYCLGLRRAENRAVRFYDSRMSAAGITSQQYTLLAVLSGSGGRSITELAGLLDLDRTTVSRNVKVLEERGIVRLLHGRGRIKRCGLTPEGERVFGKARAVWEEAQRSFESALGEERCRELLALLEEVAASL